MKTSTLKANLQLLLTAAIWGFAFVAQRLGMDHVEPFTFNAARFALGTVVLLPFLIGEFRTYKPDPDQPTLSNRALLAGGVGAGMILYVAAAMQQTALVHTTASKAGFITGLYVVLVPIMGIFWKQRAGSGTWAGAAVAAVGLYLLSIRGDFTIAFGDLLALCATFFWATHVCLVGWMSPRVQPLRLACIQFSVCAIASGITAIVREAPTLSGLHGALWPILYAGVLSVGIAYTLQIIAQRKAKPAHAAVIMSSESVFALIGGWFVLHESLTGRGLTGCSLMLAGIILSQLGLPTLRRRKRA